METAEDTTVDAAALARIEGKLETGLATIAGKIDTNMAGMNARVDALDGRVTRVEVAHEQLRSQATRRVWDGPQLLTAAVGIITALAVIVGGLVWMIQSLPHVGA